MVAASIPVTDLQDRFLSILPRIELHGRIYFRAIKCRDRRADAIQEMRSLAWKWFVRLAERGKDAGEFVSALATFAAKAVQSGRRLTGQEKAKDVFSPVAQRQHGFRVESLPNSTSTGQENLYAQPHGQQVHDAFEECLRDNTQTPVPEQAAFRIDFPRWRRTRCDRDRRIMDDMMLGERTLELSNKFGISPARVSQLRQEFHDDWQRFNGESVGEQQFDSAA